MAELNQNISSPISKPTDKVSLRPYQSKGVKQLEELHQQNVNRILFYLATGGGKTTVFIFQMLRDYAEGKPSVLVVKRRSLILQVSKILTSLGVPHGTLMAGQKYEKDNLIHICSIDTVHSRGIYPYSNDKEVTKHIDECHDAKVSNTKYGALFDIYHDHKIVGYTASPYGDNSLFEEVVSPISALGLRELGYLVPERVFCPPDAIIRTEGIRIRAGEYDQEELEERASSITGDIVSTWEKLAQDKMTICFGINKHHSKIICKAYNKAGIPAAHLDCDNSQEEREEVIRQLVDGEIKVLCNIDLFSTGVDIPSIECIQLCRPTKSLIWHIQAVGRGLRPAPNKENLLVLDHSGNYLEHGSVFLEREITTDSRREQNATNSDRPSLKFCDLCGFLLDEEDNCCPACGHVNEIASRNILTIDDDLVELDLEQSLNESTFLSDYNKFLAIRKKKQIRQSGWEFKEMIKKHGVDKCIKLNHLIPRFPVHLLTTTTKEN